MAADNEYCFEVLVIDKDGRTSITKDSSLLDALSYSEKLWKKKEIKGSNRIFDCDQFIEVKILSINTESVLTDLIEAAFILKVKGKNFEAIEKFRYPLLVHLKGKLSFTNIRILKDDVSTKIANDVYPLINNVENTLRRYLVLFFIQKIGVDWWNSTAPATLNDKIGGRKTNEKVFSPLVDTDVTLIDFDDLGGLIYKQTSGFNRQENIVNRIMSSNTLEDLLSLKQELQGNYTKYFKDAFQNNDFDKKWKKLFDIRNKVAHNNLFVYADYLSAKDLVDDLTEIIIEAENKIDTFKFSVEEQEAIREAAIQAVKAAELQNDPKELIFEKLGGNSIEDVELNDVGITTYDNDNPYRIITADELLKELEIAEITAPQRGLSYVGLKNFVTKLLGYKGYAIGPTYALVNILREKGMIDIYDANDDSCNYLSKAIKRAS